MRKIIFTLLVLTGLAAANTQSEFSPALAEPLRTAGYEPGCTYKIRFNITDVPENAAGLRLTDNYYLVNMMQSLWGFNTENSSELKDNGAYTTEPNHGTLYYSAEPGRLPVMWTGHSTDIEEAHCHISAGVEVCIDCDGRNTTITLDHECCFNSDVIILNGTALDAEKICITPQAKLQNLYIEIAPPSMSPVTIAALAGGVLALFGLISLSISPRKPKLPKNMAEESSFQS